MTTNISFSDLELPRAAVLRILKKTVTSQSVSPLVELCGLVECRKTDGTEGRQAGHYKIGDPLHFILDRRVSAFVSNSRWLTKRYSAQQNTAKMGQRTISVGHVLAALETIGFPEFVQSLKARLEAYAASREKKKTSTEDVAGADQEATSAIDIDAKIDEEEEADEEEQEQDTEEALDDQIENLEIDPAMTAYKRAHLEDMLAINADEDELTSEHTDDRET